MILVYSDIVTQCNPMSIGICAMQPAVAAGGDASLRVGRIGDATRPDKVPAKSKDQKGGLQRTLPF